MMEDFGSRRDKNENSREGRTLLVMEDNKEK